MTTKVKAKSLSQIRKEEKLRKQQRKVERMAKSKAKEVKHVHSKSTDLVDGVKQLQERLQNGQIIQPNKKLTFEEQYLKEVNELDATMADILSNIDKFGELRTELKWDLYKDQLDKEEADVIEAQIVKILESNAAYRARMVEEVELATEELNALNADPTPEGLAAFITNNSAKAFITFSLWNEDILNQYFEIQDKIEALTPGETK